MMRLSLLAMAAVGIAGVAHAQTATTSTGVTAGPTGMTTQSGTQMQPMQQGAPMTGGQVQAGTQMQTSQPMANQPAQAMAPGETGGTFKDEYGNRYNSRGDRIDARGRVIAPPVTRPGARALR